MNFGDERLPMRFWDKAVPEPTSGCWLWFAGSHAGYGTIGMGSKSAGTRKPHLAHRVSYTALVGPIPDGLHLDHLCRVRCCVNPAHLEPVTNAVNTARGLAGAKQLAKSHCPRGHAYAGENVVMQRNSIGRGARVCRICKNIANTNYRHTKTMPHLRPLSDEMSEIASELVRNALKAASGGEP